MAGPDEGVQRQVGKFNPPNSEFKAAASWGGPTGDTLVITGVGGAVLTNG